MAARVRSLSSNRTKEYGAVAERFSGVMHQQNWHPDAGSNPARAKSGKVITKLVALSKNTKK